MYNRSLKRTIMGLLLCGICGVSCAQEFIPNRIVVSPKASPTNPNRLLTAAPVADALKQVGAVKTGEITQIHVHILKIPNNANIDDAINKLQATGLFEYVEKDAIAHLMAVPNDPYYSTQWHLAKIGAPAAWDVSKGNSAIPVAILDSGVAPVADLSAKIGPGWNFLTNTNDTADTGCSTGHGTATSGTAAAATNNSIGVAGVAWLNPIMPLVIAPADCTAQYTNIASAITWAVDHGARVMNISFAGSTPSSLLQNAVNYAWSNNSIVVAAAGNNANTTLMYPAACTNAVAVGATDQNNALTSFSTYGPWVTLFAPGINIYTTDMQGTYEYWYGTSFSSPIVAGVFALMISANPTLTNAQIVTIAEQTAVNIGSSSIFGYGLINAGKAVATASVPSPPTNLTAVQR